MPRSSRIDAAGALHHIMARGIEKKPIFENDMDRNQFILRLGGLVQETKTVCYGWALLSNHFHLLLETGPVGISTVMRRLLTGYATWFNRTRERRGHLFQNRFKSILCQEDVYLLELVRYIHLNPIRAGIVQDVGELGRYPYSGHSALMGVVKREWQDSVRILRLFAERMSSARRAYEKFLEEGLGRGRRPDLTGGGLVRSAGGWEGLQAFKERNIFLRSDERILGNGEFVDQVLGAAEESIKRRYYLQVQGYDLGKIARRVAEVLGVEPSTVWKKGKRRYVVEARSLLCYWAVRELGIPMSLLAKKLELSIPSVSESVARGKRIANERRCTLIDN